MRARYFYYAIYLVIFFALIGSVVTYVWKLEHSHPPIEYSRFLDNLKNDKVAKVQLKGGWVVLTDKHDQTFQTFSPDISGLMPLLVEKRVRISTEERDQFPLIQLLPITLPFGILLLIILIFVVGNKPRSEEEHATDFAKNKMVNFSTESSPVTFDDVAGIPEAKEELQEIVSFLKDPAPFRRLGANIPRGILLQGPPGTGKTLLARAIAGEAKVPFYSFSGSDFVEMFVGVGASRVRDLFKEAKKHTPCIVFIDEIDAVGASRSGSGAMGGQDERGQTLNALLVNMDGFGRDDTIIVLAATNRPDILDPALLRPGRFDRLVTILPPDVKGRLKILEVHTAAMKFAPDVDLASIAASTPGFTGAELANLVNEAALIASRENKEAIEGRDLNEAKDRIIIGVERKGMVISEDDRRTMAYHEAGHAIVARCLPNSDPIEKITIVPRGRSMGHTQQQQLVDRHAYTKAFLRNRITILMGGRAAEQIGLSQQTTGAEGDLGLATEIANKMVCLWGMDEQLGPLAYSKMDAGFLGGSANQLAFSEHTAQKIDTAVRALVNECYHEAANILQNSQSFLRHLAEILLQTETLDREEMEIIFDCSQKKMAEGADDAEIAHECLICPCTGHCNHLPSSCLSPTTRNA
ncbi:MAG: ATP-dependent zinc metalloprotease FtsH [Proteobacteria bacterium]|nr:ATP-dependent zinc metalloprotease FtsH [Pseudomonadota bacterium]MBU1638895.1 ATP-dependent zinc metalloprotease FtsH [Pseudomonadota bacterium]